LALKIARVIKALDGCETSIDGSKPWKMLSIRKPNNIGLEAEFELLQQGAYFPAKPSLPKDK